MYKVTAIFPNGNTKEVGTSDYSDIRAFLNDRYAHNCPCVFIINKL